jgi:hypothetical protein
MGSGSGAVTSIVVETSEFTSSCVVKISPEISQYRWLYFSMTIRVSYRLKENAVVYLFVTRILMLYDTCPAYLEMFDAKC